MSEKGIFVRLPENLLNAIEKACQERGVTKTQLIAEALHQYLRGGGEKAPGLRLIALRYPARCVKCGKELTVGDLAYWSTGTVICLDCYAKQTAGVLPEVKKLYSLYKEIRRLKVLREEARKDLDELMARVEKLDIDVKLAELVTKIEEVISQVYDYMTRVESNVNLEEVKQRLIEIAEKLEELRAAKVFIVRKRVKATAV